ncbi:hypothetical protein GCM10009584_18290 [Ornithinimicrobium humiphilum]
MKGWAEAWAGFPEKVGQEAATEPHLVGQVVAVGVHHDRGVDVVEGAAAGHELLAGVALLGGRAEEHDPAGHRTGLLAEQVGQPRKAPTPVAAMTL